LFFPSVLRSDLGWSSGYTPISNAGIRVGDGAKVATLELLGYKLKKKEKKEKTKKEETAEAKS
jgi:hypothetical protein